jgi:ribosomal protein L21
VLPRRFKQKPCPPPLPLSKALAPPVVALHEVNMPPEPLPSDLPAAPPGMRFAVLDLGGAQHKVSIGSLFMTNRLKQFKVGAGDAREGARPRAAPDSRDAQVGQRVDLDRVLLVGSRDFTLIGRPVIDDARVTAVIEEHTHLEKVITFKKRRRHSSSARNRGSRADVTILRVYDINFDHAKYGLPPLARFPVEAPAAPAAAAQSASGAP